MKIMQIGPVKWMFDGVTLMPLSDCCGSLSRLTSNGHGELRNLLCNVCEEVFLHYGTNCSGFIVWDHDKAERRLEKFYEFLPPYERLVHVAAVVSSIP